MLHLTLALHAGGWTVRAPLLPGHGRTLADFGQTDARDWARASRQAYDALLATHGAVALVGLSMGGALAVRIATDGPAPASLVLLALVAAGGWAAWRYGPALLARFAPAQTPTAGSALDVCARATPADVAKALGTRAADPRHVGAGADVPAAGACTWDFGGGSIVALWFTPGSLARGRGPG